MMAKGKRIGAFAVVLCLLLCLLPGCGDAESVREAYKLPEDFSSVDTGTVAENDNYTLEWDDDYKTIMMVSKTGEKVWGTSPAAAAEDENQYTSSPIIIEAVHKIKLSSNMSRAYNGAIKDGNLSAKTIDNGVEVIYYFDEYQISVPVQYVLRDDSVAVSVDTTRITEGDKYFLKTITLAPYMCSVANIEPDAKAEDVEEEDFDDEDFDVEDFDDEDFEDLDEEIVDEPEDEPEVADKALVPLKDAYLFVPVGNGALVSPAVKDEKREYLGEVYGTDGSRYQPYEYYKEENIKMPVFGVKDGDNALVGIMENGAEQGAVQVSAGDGRSDYSNVAATFYVRGYDIYADDHSYQSTINTRLSKTMVNNTLTVGFYPLTGEDADYVGMAKKYREYLTQKGMVKSEVAESAFALSIQGNVVTQSLAFGVPYQSAKSMTSFKEAQAIIAELASGTSVNPAVQLVGYGESGMDIGQVAGGFGLAGVSGKKKDYAALTAYAEENNISLYTDFDMVFFNSNGNGFNQMFHAAKTATLHKSELYLRMLALRAQDEEKGAYRVLNRSKLFEAMDKLLKKGDKLNVTGYSFSTLGNVAYSDYADSDYEVKKGMGADVQAMFDSVVKAGHALATDNANDYAAMVSDTVFNVEIDPRYTDVFDVYVPFYQIVFKGTVPLYSESLNYVEDYDTAVLNALASGVGLGYAVLENYDPSFIASNQTNIYNSIYSANKEKILKTVEKYSDYYTAISGASISNYEVLDNGVTVTTFDNGVVAYTNNTDAVQIYPAGELAAKGFHYVQGGAN